VGLLALVCFVTLFEDYDLLIINLALPYPGTDFGADSKTPGSAVGLINVVTILAFIPVRLVDRCGRRRVLFVAIAGYTMCTLLRPPPLDSTVLSPAKAPRARLHGRAVPLGLCPTLH
jgi:putative MFS transporter